MKKKCFMVIAVLLFFGSVTTEVFGQTVSLRIRQLSEAVSSGNVTLSAQGNGSSSGNAVDGVLRNNTPNKIRINVNLSGGIYLSNSGSGQNMIATQIFLSDGGYYIESGTQGKYIELSPKINTKISFNAYCADFDLENPSMFETFSHVSMPFGLQSIAAKISRYEEENFGGDLTVSIQLALWRSQGLNRRKIEEKFDFTNDDWEIATKILNY